MQGKKIEMAHSAIRFSRLLIFAALVCLYPHYKSTAAETIIEVDTTIETGVIEVSDIIDPAGFEHSEYLERFLLKQKRFNYTIDLVSRYESYQVTSVSFPSEMKTDTPENNTVYLSYYQPLGKSNMPCAIVIGNLGGRFIMSGVVARLLVEKNIASVVIHLPYFGKRSKKKFEEIAADSISADLIQLSSIQSILDLKRAYLWLRTRPEIDPNSIGIFGISYGAIIGSLAIGIEPRFRPNVLVMAGGDIAHILWNSSRITAIKKNFVEQGYDLEKLRGELEIVDPLTYASRINRDNLIMFNGKKDTAVPVENAMKLWEKAGKPKIIWLNSGHVTAVVHLNQILRYAVGLFANNHKKPKMADHEASVRGIWVECEGDNDSLSSKEKIIRMLDETTRANFNTIFVQVYRGNRAWFSSEIADTAPFADVLEKDGIDLLRFIIDEGHRRGLKVHAWLNIFRIARNREAKMLKKLGKEIVIVDNRGRSMLDYEKYLLAKPEGQFFNLSDETLMLDPGSEKVRQYQMSIIREVIKKYPGLDGIHLDFVRYPYTVPYPPGSRYSKGIDFGYNPDSLSGFKQKTGLDPITMIKNFANTQKWDDWRRENVTRFIETAYHLIKEKDSSMELSAAVLPWSDRAYLCAFQDWRGWIERGIIDFVVPMNYTKDNTFAHYISRASINFADAARVYIGLQAYMVPFTEEQVLEQINDCRQLGAKGVVLFSYDSILLHKPELFQRLVKEIFQQKPTLKQ